MRLTSSFKYLGVPITERDINIVGLCYEIIPRAIKTAGCDGTGFPLTVSRCILTPYVRPQMEYGLALLI